ncbi:hypothetical protein ACFL6S_33075 [Candidatus Poribacteria bacterium]
MNRQEALSDIQQTAEQVLKESQEPVTRVRLLRDILHRPDDDPELVEARSLSADTKLGKRLEDELQVDNFRRALTTAMDLGLPESHPAFTKIRRYAESYLSEGVLNVSGSSSEDMSKRDLCLFERNIASMLAKVDRNSPLVEEIFGKWAIVAGVAFESGKYNREAQIQITQEIFEFDYNLRHSIKRPESALSGAATLLAARSDLLDPVDDAAYVKWCVLERRKPIVRINQLLDPSCRAGSKCLSAAEMLLDMMGLYGFRSWRPNIENVVDCLWQVRRGNGLWNFGATCINPPFLSRIRFADNWRGKRGAHDWTTRVLLLLQKYYENEELWLW